MCSVYIRERANELCNVIVVAVARHRSLFAQFKFKYNPNHWLIFNRFTFQCGAFCALFHSFTLNQSRTFFVFFHFLSPFLPVSHPFRSTNSDASAQQQLSPKLYFQLDTYFKCKPSLTHLSHQRWLAE